MLVEITKSIFAMIRIPVIPDKALELPHGIILHSLFILRIVQRYRIFKDGMCKMMLLSIYFLILTFDIQIQFLWKVVM